MSDDEKVLKQGGWEPDGDEWVCTLAFSFKMRDLPGTQFVDVGIKRPTAQAAALERQRPKDKQ